MLTCHDTSTGSPGWCWPPECSRKSRHCMHCVMSSLHAMHSIERMRLVSHSASGHGHAAHRFYWSCAGGGPLH